MNIREILPTKENLIKAFQDDALRRNRDIVSFYKILLSLNSQSTIAIDGSWGSGKTFFVKQTILLIDALNPSRCFDEKEKNAILGSNSLTNKELTESHNCIASVYYDAWQNDNDIDPAVSIVYEIAEQIGSSFTFDSSVKFMNAASSVIDIFTGKNIGEMIKNLSGTDPLSNLKEKKSIQEQIRDFFAILPNEFGDRVIIFIDELDRCKPTYAVKLLEQIKHYFADERITFVFSTNLGELQNTICNYYGNGFDSGRYLDRFFDLKIKLSIDDIMHYCDYVGLNSDNMIEMVCRRVISVYNFELREITRFLNAVSIAT